MAMSEIERIRKGLPVHYGSCRTVVYRSTVCTCTATADVEALLKWVQDADALLAELQGPEDDGR